MTSGHNISFWFDGWDGLPIAQDYSGPLNRRNISLFQARSCYHGLLNTPLTYRHHNAVQKLIAFDPAQGSDTLQWTISLSACYTVKSIYTILSQGGKLLSPLSFLWRSKVTPSMRLFMFLMLHNRILTHDNMQRRNLPHTHGCVMCPQRAPETVMHLFFGCPFARELWDALETQLGYHIITMRDTALDTYISSRPANKNSRKF